MTLVDKLKDQADGLALMAESADVTARYFRPRFEACWQDGKLTDSPLALRLRFYVLDQEDDARRLRREEAELREAIAAISSGDREP